MKNNYCILCGKPSEAEHHWIFGTGQRNLAEQDKIYDSVCNKCHTLSYKVTDRIHDNVVAEKLSKMLGQMIWEKHQVAAGQTEQKAREEFIKRYGKSYYLGD